MAMPDEDDLLLPLSPRKPRKPRTREPRDPEQSQDQRSAAARVLAMCAEQGVNPGDTLTPEDIKRWMNITYADRNMIDLIGSGYPVKSPATVLRAIEIKLDRSAPRAPTTSPDREPITITIKTETTPAKIPLPEEGEEIMPTLQARGPIIRKKKPPDEPPDDEMGDPPEGYDA